MIAPHPRLQVNVAEQLARSIRRRRACTTLRISSEPMNHAHSVAASDFFNSLLGLTSSDGRSSLLS